MRNSFLRVATLLGVVLAMIPRAVEAGPPGDDRAAAFFASPTVPRIRIEVEPDQLDKLKADPRAYVKGTLREVDGEAAGAVALKLKGAAGSFRDWDDRPALTLNVRKFRPGGSFHGLEKFHLNNSVQDETYLNEALCADLFRRGGVPTPRVTHARVWLNGRDVGLYVLKEGVDRPFLARWFPDPSGNLYDGGFLQDIDADLERDEGTGPDDRSDLKAVVAAATDPDPALRRRRIEALVDVDEFCSFMALERMTGHWDGYSNKANNYRLYFDPRTKKAVFLPHGMDQMFEDPEMGLFDPTDKIVASKILQDESFRRRYRARLAQLVPLMAPADALIGQIDALDRRLDPVIAAMNPDQAAHRRELVAQLKERLAARALNLRKQIDDATETTPEFDDRGVAPLAGRWSRRAEGEGALLDEVEHAGGAKALHIQAGEGQPCVASWRRRVWLKPGRYTLRADVRAEGVVPLEGTKNSGVGVGRSGTPRTQHLHGSTPGQALACRFDVGEDNTQVELVLELRARLGAAWFDQSSLSLVRELAPAP